MAKSPLQILFVVLVLASALPNISAQANSLLDIYDYPLGPCPLRTDAPTTTTTTQVTIADAQHYVHFTGASYCMSENSPWNCSDCVQLGPTVTLYKVVVNATTDTLVLFNLDSVRQEIIITYRGTYNVPTILSDAFVLPLRPIPGGNGHMTVFPGQYVMADSLYQVTLDTIAELIAIHSTYKVVFVGHSLGGGMASLTLVRLLTTSNYANLAYSLYTYGQPRSGNKDYADFVNALTIPLVRVVNKRDVIAHISPRRFFPDYIHHQNELWINKNGTPVFSSRTVYEDPNGSNSQGPGYKFADHLLYWTTNYAACAVENWCPSVAQFVAYNAEITAVLCGQPGTG